MQRATAMTTLAVAEAGRSGFVPLLGAAGVTGELVYAGSNPKFTLTSGHFAGPWVPSIRGVMEKHPDLIQKAVAAVTVEHLGCLEWMDDASMTYTATGKNEWRRDHAGQGDGMTAAALKARV